MFKSAASMRLETRTNMRGGKGEVEIRHLFEPGEYRGRARLLAKVTIPPGASIGLHEHGEEEEVFYVLKGRGRITDDGVTREIGPGDAAVTGGGRAHAVENPGGEPLELLAIVLTY